VRHTTRTALLAVAAILAGAFVSPAAASVAVQRTFPAAGELLRPRVAVRSAATPSAPIVRVLRQFRPDFHPEIVLALQARQDPEGDWWYQLSLPGRPNGARGWVRSGLVDVHPVRNRLVIRRAARVLEVRRVVDAKLLLRAQIAVGKPSAQTPLGRDFYVRSRFVPSNSFLGVFALETSAYAPLSDWPGDGVVGIHGTSVPSSIGRAASHGCIRLLNQNAVRLRYLAPLGTPIDVLP
jgi:hypothetical protein